MKYLYTIMQKIRHYGFKKIIQFTWSELVLKVYYQWICGSYSQYQDDVLLDKLLQHKSNGFYVDVGAYDPIRFSNTMRFYKKGWHGINIEPNTEYYKRFLEKRPKDINCNIGIGPKKGTLLYYQMDPQTLSTFVKAQAEAYEKQGFRIVNKKQISVLPLKEVFSTYKVGYIDFLSVDVEGFEMEVLQSNDWKQFRPTIVCVEIETPNKKQKKDKHPVYDFLKKQGYKWLMNNSDNAFFIDTKK